MNQIQLEKLMHPKHINKDVKQYILDTYQEEMQGGITLLNEMLNKQEWADKDRRKAFITNPDKLVIDVLSSIAVHCNKPMPFVSIASMIHINGLSKLDSIKTVSEVILLLHDDKCDTYSLEYVNGSLTVTSSMNLSQDLQDRLRLHCFLPPMVEKPKTIKRNSMSGYLTINDNVILGFKENQHNNELALDVINTLNQNAYELDSYIVKKFDKKWFREELNQDEIDDLDEVERDEYINAKITWELYQEQFQVMSNALLDKTIYFNQKYDKRGRIYTQGYHFSPMGTSYEKACLNLKQKEFITGEL